MVPYRGPPKDHNVGRLHRVWHRDIHAVAHTGMGLCQAPIRWSEKGPVARAGHGELVHIEAPPFARREGKLLEKWDGVLFFWMFFPYSAFFFEANMETLCFCVFQPIWLWVFSLQHFSFSNRKSVGLQHQVSFWDSTPRPWPPCKVLAMLPTNFKSLRANLKTQYY